MEVAKRSGLIKFLKDDQTPEGISRVENVQELMNSMQGFIEEQQQLEDGNPSLSNFLENIALSADTQKDKEDDGTDKVSLMTIHLSKGLEFPAVSYTHLDVYKRQPMNCSPDFRKYLPNTRIVFGIFWWTSIRIRIIRNTSSLRHWLRNLKTSAW